MSENKRVDIVLVIIAIWFLGSWIGILYSFRFLLSAIVCLVLAYVMFPNHSKKKAGFKALERVWAWEEGNAPMPSEAVFKQAADWFMFRDFSGLRAEDINNGYGNDVPRRVRPYIKSVKELRR